MQPVRRLCDVLGHRLLHFVNGLLRANKIARDRIAGSSRCVSSGDLFARAAVGLLVLQILALLESI
jgi:hypothetical protein